jgi:hypothetical protein
MYSAVYTPSIATHTRGSVVGSYQRVKLRQQTDMTSSPWKQSMSPALTPNMMSVLFASGTRVPWSVGENQGSAYPISFGIRLKLYEPLSRPVGHRCRPAGWPGDRPTAEGYETRKSGYTYDITGQVNVVELVLSLRNKSVYRNSVASVCVWGCFLKTGTVAGPNTLLTVRPQLTERTKQKI